MKGNVTSSQNWYLFGLKQIEVMFTKQDSGVCFLNVLLIYWTPKVFFQVSFSMDWYWLSMNAKLAFKLPECVPYNYKDLSKLIKNESLLRNIVHTK